MTGYERPLVPGHEIVGYVTKVGANVKKFKVGDRAGAGHQIWSCSYCDDCCSQKESYCPGSVKVFGGKLPDGYVNKGGFAQFARINERFVFHVPDNISTAEAAPLFCAGITVYAPLKYAKVGPGSKVGIAGIGGLGHLGIKIAKALGAEVYALSTTPSKKDDCLRMGATHFINYQKEGDVDSCAKSLDVIVSAASELADFSPLFKLLKNHGILCSTGLPAGNIQVPPWELIRNLNLMGTLAGSPSEIEEMLVLCSQHNIGAQVEIVPLEKVNESFERLQKREVRYRVVLAVNPGRN